MDMKRLQNFMPQVVDDRWLWSYQKSEKTELRFGVDGNESCCWACLSEFWCLRLHASASKKVGISPHRPPEIYYSTSVTQNLEHVDMVVDQYTLSFYCLFQILRSLPVSDSVETLLSLPSLAPRCLFSSTHTTAHTANFASRLDLRPLAFR